MSNYAGISRAVSAKLLSVASVTAIVGQRVRPDLLDQGEAYPGITFRLVDAGYSPGITGSDTLPSPQFEVACWARDRDESVSLADVVIAALEDEGPDTWSPSTGDVTVTAATFLNSQWVLAEDVDGGNKPICGVMLTFEFQFRNS